MTLALERPPDTGAPHNYPGGEPWTGTMTPADDSSFPESPESAFAGPPPLERWGEDAYKAAFVALTEQFPRSGPAHAAPAEGQPLAPSYRASIVGASTVGADSNPNFFVSAAANPRAGALTLAAGTTHAAAIAAAHGFTQAMEHAGARHVDLDTAFRTITTTVEQTVPHIADRTVTSKPRSVDTAANELPSVSLVTAQLVGEDQLTFTGRRPVYRFHMDSGESRDHHDEKGGGSVRLRPGRHVLIMSSRRRPNDDTLSTTTLTTALSGVLGELRDEHRMAYRDDMSLPHPSDQAAEIANRLRSRLLAQGIDIGTVQLALVDVEQDRSSTGTSTRSHLMPLIASTGSFANKAADLTGRAVYGEGGHLVPRLQRLRTTVGAAALVVTGTAAAYAGVRYGLGHAGIHLPSLLELLPHRSAPHTTAQPKAEDADTSQPGNTPQDVLGPSSTVTHAEPEPFADTDTALLRDPELGGRTTSVDLLSSHIITYYGNQYHLPPDEIVRLAHDPELVSKVGHAFMHDQANTHNRAVLESHNHYLNENDDYSTHAQAQAAQQAVLARAHALGIDINTTTEIVQPSTNQTVAPAAPSTPIAPTDHVPTEAENIANFKHGQHLETAGLW
jgi:hypothetical protein